MGRRKSPHLAFKYKNSIHMKKTVKVKVTCPNQEVQIIDVTVVGEYNPVSVIEEVKRNHPGCKVEIEIHQ